MSDPNSIGVEKCWQDHHIPQTLAWNTTYNSHRSMKLITSLPPPWPRWIRADSQWKQMMTLQDMWTRSSQQENHQTKLMLPAKLNFEDTFPSLASPNVPIAALLGSQILRTLSHLVLLLPHLVGNYMNMCTCTSWFNLLVSHCYSNLFIYLGQSSSHREAIETLSSCCSSITSAMVTAPPADKESMGIHENIV